MIARGHQLGQAPHPCPRRLHRARDADKASRRATLWRQPKQHPWRSALHQVGAAIEPSPPTAPSGRSTDPLLTPMDARRLSEARTAADPRLVRRSRASRCRVAYNSAVAPRRIEGQRFCSSTSKGHAARRTRLSWLARVRATSLPICPGVPNWSTVARRSAPSMDRRHGAIKVHGNRCNSSDLPSEVNVEAEQTHQSARSASSEPRIRLAKEESP
jgi:hypothetical protein